MTAWKRDVREPFASNDDFWLSVASSVDGLLSLALAAVLTVVFGPLGAIAFLLPAGLLLRAGLTGARSGRSTRPLFTDQTQWREAERQAVWSVLASAVVRPRWRIHRA